jgi:hypothetical protein
MAYDVIKNKEVVKGIFSSCYTDSTDSSHKKFFPHTTSIEEGLDFIISHFEKPSGSEQYLPIHYESSILFMARKTQLPG